MAEFTIVTSHVVSVFVTSSVSTFRSERRFQKDLTVGALKGKLELLTGGQAGSMKVEVYNKDDKQVCELDNDDALLGSYPIDDEFRLHVIDNSGKLGEFEDVSKVEKFELSEDAYAKKADSVRAFKQKMKMGRFADKDPEEEKRQAEVKKQKEDEEKALMEGMKVGDRCEVHATGQPEKRGTVMHVGTAEFKEGNWVGVKYDEPLGKNDGSVGGKRYFECPPKYGGFVKPAQVTVGDYPEIDEFDDMDEM